MSSTLLVSSCKGMPLIATFLATRAAPQGTKLLECKTQGQTFVIAGDASDQLQRSRCLTKG